MAKAISIIRSLSSKKLEMIENDLEFLLESVRNSNGELDLQLRSEYINIYYKGNSLAKISPNPKSHSYRFEVNSSFGLAQAVGGLRDARLNVKNIFGKAAKGDYETANVPAGVVHPFFQKKVVNKLQSQIKKHGYGEEITFEQSLITDNLNDENMIIVDRQIQMSGEKGRMDLLALKRKRRGVYSFVILEVKLGDNKELKSDVAQQLKKYIQTIDANFGIFSECYQENYKQKRILNTIGNDTWPDEIKIEKPVDGRIVVGLYSGHGESQLQALITKHPNLKKKIIRFWHKIDLTK